MTALSVVSPGSLAVAFWAYGSLNRNPIQFYDTRVTEPELAQARVTTSSRPIGVHLRLAFSGRWIPQKDPFSAVRLTNQLMPVVAANNRYWKQFQTLHGAGWSVPVDNMDALVATVSRLAFDPGEIEAHRARGLDWAKDHSFEREFQRRIDHLRRIAQV